MQASKFWFNYDMINIEMALNFQSILMMNQHWFNYDIINIERWCIASTLIHLHICIVLYIETISLKGNFNLSCIYIYIYTQNNKTGHYSYSHFIKYQTERYRDEPGTILHNLNPNLVDQLFSVEAFSITKKQNKKNRIGLALSPEELRIPIRGSCG